MYKLVIKPQAVQQVALPREYPVSTQKRPASVDTQEEPNGSEKDRSARQSVPEARSGDKPGRAELARMRAQIIDLMKEMVAGASSPVLLARASQYVVNKLGPQVLETQWGGMGSFKRLLQSASGLGLEITTQPEPGYIFDPQRHVHPAQVNEAQENALQDEQDLEPSTATEIWGIFTGEFAGRFRGRA